MSDACKVYKCGVSLLCLQKKKKGFSRLAAKCRKIKFVVNATAMNCRKILEYIQTVAQNFYNSLMCIFFRCPGSRRSSHKNDNGLTAAAAP